MPMAGGDADKEGNRYEMWWAVLAMVRLLDGRASAIRIEPPGVEGWGIEFVLRSEGADEYHQVKRQQANQSNWTLNALENERVLTNFRGKFGPTARATCHFVSIQPARELGEISDRARKSGSVEEFENAFLTSDALKHAFVHLQKIWETDEQHAWEWLNRLYVRTIDELGVRDQLRAMLRPQVEGDEDTAAEILFALGFEQVQRELAPIDLWSRLEERGIGRSTWVENPDLKQAVARLSARYASRGAAQVSSKYLLQRQQVRDILELLGDGTTTKVLIAGQAGMGKSWVLANAVCRLLDHGTHILALRVDELQPTIAPENLGRQLGLPGSPAAVLAAIAAGTSGVLVIDQLDAVSLASGRNPQFFEVIRELIDEALAHSNLAVLVGCRQFDIDNDSRLRALASDSETTKTVNVGPLSEADVREALSQLGLDASNLTPGQLKLLAVPLHLRLLAETARSDKPLDFETVTDLYDRFWEYKRQLVEKVRLGRPSAWVEVVRAMTDHMSANRVLSAPAPVLDQWAEDAQAMASEHVLVRNRPSYSFFHEGFLDYCYARLLVVDGRRLTTRVVEGPQDLFIRAQVRQVLAYLRDTAPPQYVADLGELLTSGDVRFHVKQVALSLLRTYAVPRLEESSVLSELVRSDDVSLAAEAWRVLHGSAAWFDLLDANGTLKEWLARNDLWTDRCVQLLAGVSEARPERVAALLDPFAGEATSDAVWRQRFTWVMSWYDPARGDTLFDLFIRLLDDGVLDEARGPIAVNSDFFSVIDRPYMYHR